MTNLKQQVEKLPPLENTERTYLETLKVSSKETVMANLLAFYFNSNEKHGLNDLFLQALLDTDYYLFDEKKSVRKLREEIRQLKNEDLKIRKVKTEDVTGENKRIDILIETEKLVVAIEFKINHQLDNPLKKYIKHIEENKSYKDKEKLFLILSPYWKKPAGPANVQEAGQFKQVVLSELIAQVEAKMKSGTYLLHKEDPQYHFLNDFIKTVKNRRSFLNLIDNYKNNFSHPQQIKEIDHLYKELRHLPDDVIKDHPDLKRTLYDFVRIKDFLWQKVKEVKKDKRMEGYEFIGGGINDKLCSALYKRMNGHILKVRLHINGWMIEWWKGKQWVDQVLLEHETHGDYYAAPHDIVDKVMEFEQRKRNELAYSS